MSQMEYHEVLTVPEFDRKLLVNTFQGEEKNSTNLDKAERQEGDVVSTEEGVKQHFFDSPVKIAL